MQLQHLPLLSLGWLGRLLKRQRLLKTLDFVIPGTSTIAVKADEDGVQKRSKEDWLQGALNLRRGLWCAMGRLDRMCWEAPRPNTD